MINLKGKRALVCGGTSGIGKSTVDSLVENGADVVHTIRTKRLGESKFKLYVTKLAYKTINLLSDIKLPVEAGDFKLISKRALEKILEQIGILKFGQLNKS